MITLNTLIVNFRNQLTDDDDCLDYLMKQPHIMPRLNDRILKDENSVYLDYTGEALPSLRLEHFAAIHSKEILSATMAKHCQYMNSQKDETKLHVLTVWAVADLESSQGKIFLIRFSETKKRI
jgi:UDP-glucose:glycoprotein glucosyltransferase